MDISKLNIHKMDDVPRVLVTEHSDFFTIEVNAGDDDVLSVKFFLHSLQQVVNFKNNFLWAVERPIKI